MVLNRDWVQLQNQDMMKVALNLAELSASKVGILCMGSTLLIQEEES